MALIEQWTEQTEGAIYIDFVSKTWPTEEAPYFCTKTKNENGGYNVDKKYSEIGGTVISVVKNETEYNGRPVRAFHITLEDWEDKIIISPTLTNASRNMLNALLWSVGEVITLKPYLNKAGYPDVSCKVAGTFAKTLCEYNDKEIADKIWAGASEPEIKEEEAITEENLPF